MPNSSFLRLAPAVCAGLTVTMFLATAQAQPAPAPAAPPPAAAAGAYAATAPPAYPGYPAPSYAPPPPGYTYAPPPTLRVPDNVSYEGGPIPAGYHLESRPRRGLVIGGAIVLGVPYVLGLSIASGQDFPNKTGWLVVPGIGPWITLAARHRSGCNSSDLCTGDAVDSATRTFLILDGLMQTAGAVMFITGIAAPRTVIARDFMGRLQLTPSSIGQTGYGARVIGTF